MAAWGAKPFQNELASDYMLTIVNTHIHPVIVEHIVKPSIEDNLLKHKLAYYYDRFRAAVELMIMFESIGSYKFAKGYYDIAIEKLTYIRYDINWALSWDNKSGSKDKNYKNDIDRQLEILKEFRDKARND
jgi:hypothetical protein